MAGPAATATANSDDGHAVLPTADALFVFLEGLRRDGFRITAGQIAAAQRLLLDAHAGGPDSPAAQRLKYRLTPLIAKSAQEQEDFYRRFDEVWRGPVILGRVEPGRHTPGAASEVIRRNPRRRILAAAVALFLGLAGLASWWLWTSPPPHTQPSSPPNPVPPVTGEVPRAHDLPPERFEIYTRRVSPFYPGVKVAFTNLPAFALLAWLLVRWRRRRLWLSRGIALGDARLATLLLPPTLAGGLFTGHDFRAGANDLRRHRWLPTRQLDVGRTVEATAHRAGLFLPVWQERRQLPEYVFMIERDGANDHLAQLFDLAVERLRDEHVVIQRYYFQGDPRQLLSDDEKRTPVPLAELAARTDDHRLFVIGTADGFFHPLTSDVESWVGRLDPWRSRTLLSTKPLQEWGLPELTLLEEGFSLVTAEVQSFGAVGEKMAIGDDRAELLGGVVVIPALASDPAPAVAPASAAFDLPLFTVFLDVDAAWCPELVLLPAGEFLMGSPAGEEGRYNDEGPQHRVRIDARFALGRYPVTYEEYDHFCAMTKRELPGDAGWGRGRRPVINVSWRDAVAYCEWLSRETGQPYRLPSEAEWEYACRAGTTTRYSWGDAITPEKANYFDSKHGKTTEVGGYPANSWGLYDMHGNVWEWVEDVWYDTYEGAPTDGSAWTDSEGKESSRARVDRGGSWLNYSRNLRSAIRIRLGPGGRNGILGFRVARTLD